MKIKTSSGADVPRRPMLDLSGATVTRNVRMMHEFKLEMDDGTKISGRFPTKKALRDALEQLMIELERMPNTTG